MTKRNKNIFNIVLAGCFIAIGWVLPFVTGNIRLIGNMLSPMHLPVYFAGLILGPWYGLIIGIIIPITRYLIFGAPVLFPNAVCMSVELGTYGLVSGLMFNYILKNFRKNTKELMISVVISLVIAMIVGRVVWGLSRMAALLIPDTSFSFKMFINGAILTAWPGMIIQLVLIPLLMLLMKKKFIINDNDLEEVKEE